MSASRRHNSPELWRRFFPRVFAYAYAQVGDEALASLLAKSILERAGSLGLPANEVAIFKLAMEELRDWRTSGVETSGAARGLFEEGDPQQARAARLFAAMRRLSPDDQELLSLVFDAGLEYRQIADMEGTDPDKVSVAVLHAIEKLARLAKGNVRS